MQFRANCDVTLDVHTFFCNWASELVCDGGEWSKAVWKLHSINIYVLDYHMASQSGVRFMRTVSLSYVCLSSP